MNTDVQPCPHCGQTNPTGTLFCGHCGRPFAAPPQPATAPTASTATLPKRAGCFGGNLLLAGALVLSACLACSLFSVWYSTTPAYKNTAATSEARRTATARAVDARSSGQTSPASTPEPADTVRPSRTPSRAPRTGPQATSTPGPLPAASQMAAPSNTPAPTATSAPTATQTPEPTAPSFREIRDQHERLTEAQWNEYTRSLEGLAVHWTGWVDEVSEGWFGDYTLRVDVDHDGLYDVSLPISREDALRLMKDQKVTFNGTIDSVNALFWVTVTLQDAVMEP